jgi:hypothetical protein
LAELVMSHNSMAISLFVVSEDLPVGQQGKEIVNATHRLRPVKHAFLAHLRRSEAQIRTPNSGL